MYTIHPEPDNEYLGILLWELNFVLTLSYSAEINTMICLSSEGYPAHPVGYNSPLHIKRNTLHTFLKI
jgi:hypothetical protein